MISKVFLTDSSSTDFLVFLNFSTSEIQINQEKPCIFLDTANFYLISEVLSAD